MLPNSLLSNSDLPNNVLPNSIYYRSDLPDSNLSNSACNLLLPKEYSYLFPFNSIQYVNVIDFTCHSHLYFNIQHWIISLILLFKLLVSSFQLECVCTFNRYDSPSYIGLRSSVTMLKVSFPSFRISNHSLSSSSIDNNLSCYRSLMHGSSF